MTVATKKPPLEAGPFQLRDLLGSGGFGEVWHGVREQPYFQEVAVKIPRPDRCSEDALLRFEAERQTMALLNHTNVIRFFEGGTLDNGDPFYAMEFVDGLSITEFCDDQELTINERVALFAEACDGVAFVHEHGILHRDIKPANLIVDEASGNPTVKLIDFGIARCSEFDELGLVVGQTLDGALLGTRDYSSPEQIDGRHSDLDETSDVFSLGAVLCELICSVKPLDDKTLSESSISEIVDRLANGPSIRPDERFSQLESPERELAAKKRGGDVGRLTGILSGDLGEIVMRAISASPDDRYSTATELAADLRRFLAGDPIEAAKSGRKNANWILLNPKLLVTTIASVIAISIGLSTQFFGSVPPLRSEDGDSSIIQVDTNAKPNRLNTEVEATIHQCRERIARAEVYWEQDKTSEAIADLKSVKDDVAAGKLDFFNGRYLTQRREINCQVNQMLIFCLLETGQVNEAQKLLNQLVPQEREKVKFHSKNKGWLESVWKSSLASLITLKGDAERLRGHAKKATTLYAEAVQIVDQLDVIPGNKPSAVLRWGCQMGLPHGRLADLMVRPNSLVPSTRPRREWMEVSGESRSPMELYRTERKILESLSGAEVQKSNRQIAMSFMKETRSWSDIEEYEKAVKCLQSAGDLLKTHAQNDSGEWDCFKGLLGESGGLDQLPDYTLNRVQFQLLETERWMLQAIHSLAKNEEEEAHEHFAAAQAVADRLAEKYPEAPEFLHYAAQVKLRVADEFFLLPGSEIEITQLRNLASEALSSLKAIDSENSNWNQTLRYAGAK